MPQLFPEFDQSDKYPSGFMLPLDAQGRYRSVCIEGAIRTDNAEAIKDAHTKGWIMPATRALFGETVPRYCELKGAVNCASALRALGYDEM